MKQNSCCRPRACDGGDDVKDEILDRGDELYSENLATTNFQCIWYLIVTTTTTAAATTAANGIGN